VERKTIALLTMGVWVVIIITGLWPFNFFAANQMVWRPDGEGLQFEGYGQIYSVVPLILPKGEAAEAAIELVFTPAKSYKDTSSLFSLINQGEVTFGIGQSVADLFLQGSFSGDTVKPVRRLWIDGACGQARQLFVTVTLTTRHVDVYLDGRLARSFPVSTRADALSGDILIGHASQGGAAWNGDVARIAVFAGRLDAAEISHRYEQWVQSRSLADMGDRQGAVYEFLTPSWEFVSSIGKFGPDLTIPKFFRVQRPTVLEWPDRLNSEVVTDAVINIVGFVPFGLTTCLFLHEWTRWREFRCVAIAILLGSAVSLAIELLQVFLPTRDSSLADLVTNISGAAIGAGAAVTYMRKGCSRRLS
jgi:VanZ family protein